MTARFIALAIDYRMDLDGWLVAHGSPYGLGDLTIERLTAFVWWFFTREADTAARTKFEARLWRPPKDSTEPIPPQSPWSAEREMASFAALKAETTSAPPPA